MAAPAPASKPSSPNKGYLVPNKKTNPNQPDVRGKINIAGKDYLLSGWLKKTDDGTEMTSLAVTDPADLPARSAPASASAGAPAASPAAKPASGDGVDLSDIFAGT